MKDRRISDKQYRLAHRAERNNQKQMSREKNYREIGTDRSQDHWMESEIIEILSPDRPCDRITSQRIGRTILAIQVMRAKLKAATAKQAGP